MGIRKEYVEDGRKIIEYDDGARSTKCVSEACIQDHVSDNESEPMSHNCNCESCSTKRLMKSDEDTLDTESVELLDRELPDEIFEQVMEHFKVEQVDEEPIDDVPEEGEEIGKSLAEGLYDNSRPEPSGGVPASNHLGNPHDEIQKSGGTPGSAEVYSRSLVEKETVDLSKSADTPDSLDRFYEKVES